MVRVTWKDEGPAGPVRVLDMDALQADPQVRVHDTPAGPSVSVARGYQPAGVNDLGWRTHAQALLIAQEYGVALEVG